MKLYTFKREDGTVIEQVRAEHWQHALSLATSKEINSLTDYESEGLCSRCNAMGDDIRVITDSPYFGICKTCRDEIDKMLNENMEHYVRVPEGTKCSCCDKVIEDKYLMPSSFGGYKNPEFGFTCMNCNDASQAEYERQQIETELSGRDW